jgi:hypothetical protein
MNRQEAVNFLHNEKGYSRRMSAKLVDVVMEKGDGAMFEALKKSIEKNLEKKIVMKYVVKR